MFSDYLNKSERIACIKAGALAYAGMLDGGVDAAKTLWVLAAAGAGIPIGVASHIIGRRIAGKRLREEELKEKIKLYQSAADEMAAGLGGGM